MGYDVKNVWLGGYLFRIGLLIFNHCDNNTLVELNGLSSFSSFFSQLYFLMLLYNSYLYTFN